MTGRMRPPQSDPQMELPICLCGRCKGEVYSGECIFRWERQRICVDCFKGVITALLNDAPLEIAGELSVEHETV